MSESVRKTKGKNHKKTSSKIIRKLGEQHDEPKKTEENLAELKKKASLDKLKPKGKKALEIPFDEVSEVPRAKTSVRPNKKSLEKWNKKERPNKKTQEWPNKMALDLPNEMAQEKPDKKTLDPPEKMAPEKPNKNTFERPSKRALEQPNKMALELPKKGALEQPKKNVPEKPDNNTVERPSKRVTKALMKKALEALKEEEEPPTKNPLKWEYSSELPGENALDLLSENLSDTPTQRPFVSKSLRKAMKREDLKYPDIDFNVPPAVWSKDDKDKMRDIIRFLSIQYKKQSNLNRVSSINIENKNFGPVEMEMIRDIIEMLHKESVLLNTMGLRDVALSIFSSNTYEWDLVSDLLDGKFTPAECKEYWYMDLYPEMTNMGFNEESNDKLLTLAIANNFRDWEKVTVKMFWLTEYQCYVHFRRNLYKMVEAHKAKAKEEEDEYDEDDEYE